MSRRAKAIDLVCVSHVRWDSDFGRPQHLMSRCSAERRVFYVETPALHDGPAELIAAATAHGPVRLVPKVPRAATPLERHRQLKALLDVFLASAGLGDFVLWYDTAAALPFTRHLSPRLLVWDVPSALERREAPTPELESLETELISRADLVFTGGHGHAQAKKKLHLDVHAFPSSVDVLAFAGARGRKEEPADQAPLPRPRVGFFGAVDERLDLPLLARLAGLKPSWQFVVLGPLALDPEWLPRRSNLHWLGPRPSALVPAYLSGWDVGLLPWSVGDATRGLGPTRALELLAAGRPVVSTPVADVVHPLGELGLVEIASSAEAVIEAVSTVLTVSPRERALRVEAYLAASTWDATWARMKATLEAALGTPHLVRPAVAPRSPSSPAPPAG